MPAHAETPGQRPASKVFKTGTWPVAGARRGSRAGPEPEAVLARYRKAVSRRERWESLWQECYEFALPHRDGSLVPGQALTKPSERLFDGTAPDAVDQLAASLLSQLTPPWARWFGLTTGSIVPEDDRADVTKALEEVVGTVQSHFDRSNFAVELHQCYLDLVTIGTACLAFEEAPPGDPSAFRFTAVPIGNVAFEEDAAGRLTGTFRKSLLTDTQFKERFPAAKLPDAFAPGGSEGAWLSAGTADDLI